MNIRRHGIAACILGIVLASSAQVGAIELQNMKGFEEYFGRYAPNGDCARQPQVVIDLAGFSFEGGPALPKVVQPVYAASYMGNFYEGISLSFFPYPQEPRPYLLTLNAAEARGVMTIEAYEYDYAGGPALPDKYRPYIAGSPYRKCR